MTEGRPAGPRGLEGRRGIPPLTFAQRGAGRPNRFSPRCCFFFIGFPFVMHLEIEMMSPTRPEREEDLSGTTAAPGRPRGGVQPTIVSGASEVAARIELHLAQCRRRRSGLALLCISVEAMQGALEVAGADLERQVRDEVAARICSGVRGTDRVLRESDRDACVLLPDATDAVAHRVAKRFARILNGPYAVAGQLVQVTVRIGVAAHPQDGSGASELLRRAMERNAEAVGR